MTLQEQAGPTYQGDVRADLSSAVDQSQLPSKWGDFSAPSAVIRCGDALDILRTIPPRSVDAVVTDPPYAIHSKTGQMLGQVSANYHEKGTHSRGFADCDPVAFGAWCLVWLAECYRVLKPGAHLVAFSGTKTVFRLGVAAETAGFEIRDLGIWQHGGGAFRGKKVKRNGVFTGLASGLRPVLEPMVIARKPLEGTLEENLETWGVGALDVHASVAAATHGKWPTGVFAYSKPGRSGRVVVDGVKHPTVKPLDLMSELVRIATPRGGMVLDPFAGSGTTLEAALVEGRSCIAIESDPSYVALIEARRDRQSGR